MPRYDVYGFDNRTGCDFLDDCILQHWGELARAHKADDIDDVAWHQRDGIMIADHYGAGVIPHPTWTVQVCVSHTTPHVNPVARRVFGGKLQKGSNRTNRSFERTCGRGFQYC